MEGPIKKVMVYVDGTEQSVTAAQYAVCLCRAIGATLTALYVINTRALQDLVKARIFLKSEEEEYQQDLEADAQRYLNHVKELSQQKGLSVDTVQARGTVHMEIKNKVSELDIDILVLGELSRIRSRRDEFYDEAERAMRNVQCSVLIVKDADRVWEMYEAL